MRRRVAHDPHGTSLAAALAMLALPHILGSECISVLRLMGFREELRKGGLVTLSRGASGVIVPETATLGPALVSRILRAAGVDPLDFVHVFEAETCGGAAPVDLVPSVRPPRVSSRPPASGTFGVA